MNSNFDLAPIGLSTYSRLQHLQRTVAALQSNELAEQSELFVFSDGPKPGDEEKVLAVRQFLKNIKGFKKVNIFERQSNDRIFNNRTGMNLLLDRFGRMIFLEEDIVTGPGFLTFMNQALDTYRDNPKVFSICGYCPPIAIPKNYQADIFLLRRFSAWGFGIWKNRFDQFRYIKPEEYEEFSADPQRVRDFESCGGTDLMPMLKADAYGEIDAADVKLMYAQFLSDQYTVYPSHSLVTNIGFDGTGMHCGKLSRFNVTLSDKISFRLPGDIIVDNRIVRANSNFRDGIRREIARLEFMGKVYKVVRLPRLIIGKLFRIIKRRLMLMAGCINKK